MSKKFAIIGTGYWGRVLESKLKKLGKVVYWSNSRAYNDINRDIDWVFVATPATTHFTIALELITLGFNVFLEKPPAIKFTNYKQLVDLSIEKKCKLLVDNVFLLRDELVKKSDFFLKTDILRFTWEKFGPFNDSILFDLLYHDLYILSYYKQKGDIKIKNIKIEEDLFLFEGKLDNTYIEINYNRKCNNYLKKIENDSNYITLNKTSSDPLMTLLENIISDSIDYDDNVKINLLAMKMFDRISLKVGIDLIK